MEDNLLIQVEQLKNLLVSRATGRGSNNDDFVKLRRSIVSNDKISSFLPRLVRTYRSLDEFWPFIKQEYSSYEARSEYLRKEFQPLLDFLERSETTPSDASITATLHKFDAAYVKAEWGKALSRRNSDPEGAITIARSLLESVCKHILDEAKIEYEDSLDLPKLYRKTSETLKLLPSQHDEQIFKQILGGCTAVVEGLGALRNRQGDAHGKGRKSIKPAPRHAELAVNLSGSMASYLFSTWENCNKK